MEGLQEVSTYIIIIFRYQDTYMNFDYHNYVLHDTSSTFHHNIVRTIPRQYTKLFDPDYDIERNFKHLVDIR